MVMTAGQIAAALDKISERIGIADRAFDEYIGCDDEWSRDNSAWHLELAFIELLALTEALGLPVLRGDIAGALAAARNEGLLKGVTDPDGEPHQKWASSARKYWAALDGNYGTEPRTTITKDLESILRDAAYSITDPRVFSSPPSDEACVHLRLENLLRCIFPDLVHKPRLGKPIKNFEPDTGIPSIQALIEYKFLASVEQVGPIADQLLADTRGYRSREWTSFVYVIYETERFKSEAQWRELLRQCGVESSAGVVVLSGHQSPRKRSPQRRPHKRLDKTPHATMKRHT